MYNFEIEFTGDQSKRKTFITDFPLFDVFWIVVLSKALLEHY